jgi:hypothetical protein
LVQHHARRRQLVAGCYTEHLGQARPDWNDPLMPRLGLSCAKLVLTDVAGKLSVTWIGAKELAPASGSIVNGTAWLVSANAPEGLIASRLLGASGSWIDRVGFGAAWVS